MTSVEQREFERDMETFVDMYEAAQDTVESAQHKICPKCGWKVKIYETGRSLCTRGPCDYEGPGIVRAVYVGDGYIGETF